MVALGEQSRFFLSATSGRIRRLKRVRPLAVRSLNRPASQGADNQQECQNGSHATSPKVDDKFVNTDYVIMLVLAKPGHGELLV